MICIDIYSAFTSRGEASAFLFLLFKLSWINCLQTDWQRHSSIIVSVICIALFLLFNLDTQNDIIERNDQLSKILLFSEKQYIQISEDKNLPWDRDWNLTVFDLSSENCLVPMLSICFFFILWGRIRKGRNTLWKRLNLNWKRCFHTNCAFYWKKLYIYLWSGSHAKKRIKNTDYIFYEFKI